MLGVAAVNLAKINKLVFVPACLQETIHKYIHDRVLSATLCGWRLINSVILLSVLFIFNRQVPYASS